jgi:uncharacterized membrane protein YeiB
VYKYHTYFRLQPPPHRMWKFSAAASLFFSIAHARPRIRILYPAPYRYYVTRRRRKLIFLFFCLIYQFFRWNVRIMTLYGIIVWFIIIFQEITNDVTRVKSAFVKFLFFISLLLLKKLILSNEWNSAVCNLLEQIESTLAYYQMVCIRNGLQVGP